MTESRDHQTSRSKMPERSIDAVVVGANEVAAKGYEGFELSPSPSARA
jgi:hypothetical protein